MAATVVGPSAPERPMEKDPQAEDKKREWASLRDVMVTLAKRWEMQEPCPQPEPTEEQRAKLAKLQDTKPREAPALPPSSDTRYMEDEGFESFGLVSHHLEPPFRLDILCRLLEDSSSLRPNIDAMATNIDGFGYRFVPILDFKKPEIGEQVRDLIVMEKLREEEIDDLLDEVDEAMLDRIEPTPEEVLERKGFWERLARIEKGRIQALFHFINPLESFTSVRMKTREDLELLGNACWEIIREDDENPDSKVEQIYHIPFVNVRLLHADKKPTPTRVKVRCDPIRFQEIDVERYFRRFVRITGNHRIYYKEYGDPRFVSRDSGNCYKSIEDLRKKEGADAKLANEILHWKIPSQISPYGVPRWIGSLLSVLGSRAADEVNFIYFDNKAIPPMIMMVSGGRLTDQAVHKIESYVEDKIKGRENYHKIMVIEGLPADADVSEGDIEHSGKLRIELKPLLDAQLQDALFQEYDKNNQLKVGRSFRQPQLLTGNTKDMNRSTAEVAKAFAEEQIYQPKRTAFDDDIDRLFMVDWKVHFWRFKTNAPVQRIPNDLVDNAKKGLDSGGLTPNEARELFADAFSMELEHIDEPWGNVPPKMALAAARQGSFVGGEVVAGPEEDNQPAEFDIDDDPEVVASGKTAEHDGHSHRFVAVKRGAKLLVTVFEADGHGHTSKSIRYRAGKKVEIEITEKGEGAHSHKVAFTPKLSKSDRRSLRQMKQINETRESIRQVMEDFKDDFFNPKNSVGDE